MITKQSKHIDLNYLKQTLLHLDPTLEDAGQESFQTPLVLLAALAYGPNVQKLASATSVPVEFVATIYERMISAELWTHSGDLCCDHWYASDGDFCGSNFWLDVLVAEGQVVRQWIEQQGQYRYWSKQFAPARALKAKLPQPCN